MSPSRRRQRSWRRGPSGPLARLLVIAALVLTPASLAGCGSAAHYVGGQIAHHVANHVLGKKKANEAFCFYNVYRTAHDFSHHHYLFGALNAHAAYVNCRNGFAKNAN